MADKTLLDISGRMYASEALAAASGGADIIKGAKSVLDPYFLESKIKTEAFIASIPADFNMSKVPPELRDKLKNYTVEKKAEYSEAAKLAGRLNSTDPRYQEAIDKMNEIRFGFENILGDITHLKQFRDDGIKNNGNRSKINSNGEIILENSIVNGDAFAGMTFGNDGLSIMKDGEVVNIKGVLSNQLVDTAGTAGFSSLATTYKNNVQSENAVFDEDMAINDVTTFMNTLGNRGSAGFAYDGLNGDATGKSSFIDKHIQENLEIAKFEADGVTVTKEFEDKYDELRKPGAFDSYKSDFQNHLIGVLREQHDARVLELQQSRIQTDANQPVKPVLLPGGQHMYPADIKARINDIKGADDGTMIVRNDGFGTFEKRNGVWYETRTKNDGTQVETKVTENHVITTQGYSRFGSGSASIEAEQGAIGSSIAAGDYEPFRGGDGNMIEDKDLEIVGQNINGTYQVRLPDGTIENMPMQDDEVVTFDPEVDSGEGDTEVEEETTEVQTEPTEVETEVSAIAEATSYQSEGDKIVLKVGDKTWKGSKKNKKEIINKALKYYEKLLKAQNPSLTGYFINKMVKAEEKKMKALNTKVKSKEAKPRATGDKDDPITLQKGEKPTVGKYYIFKDGVVKRFDGKTYE